MPPYPRSFDDPVEAEWADGPTHAPSDRLLHRAGAAAPTSRGVPFSRTYIRATADEPDAPGTAVFEALAARAQSSPAWGYAEIATNHMIPNNRPRELADVLLAIASGH